MVGPLAAFPTAAAARLYHWKLDASHWTQFQETLGCHFPLQAALLAYDIPLNVSPFRDWASSSTSQAIVLPVTLLNAVDQLYPEAQHCSNSLEHSDTF